MLSPPKISAFSPYVSHVNSIHSNVPDNLMNLNKLTEEFHCWPLPQLNLPYDQPTDKVFPSIIQQYSPSPSPLLFSYQIFNYVNYPSPSIRPISFTPQQIINASNQEVSLKILGDNVKTNYTTPQSQ